MRVRGKIDTIYRGLGGAVSEWIMRLDVLEIYLRPTVWYLSRYHPNVWPMVFALCRSRTYWGLWAHTKLIEEFLVIP